MSRETVHCHEVSRETVHCHARGCRRTISRAAVKDQYPKADGWALVSSNYGHWFVHLCPIHRLELEEAGCISPKARPKSVYGQPNEENG